MLGASLFGGKKQEALNVATSLTNTWTRNNQPTFIYSSPNATGGVLDLISSNDPTQEISQRTDQQQKDTFDIGAAVGVGPGATATSGKESNYSDVKSDGALPSESSNLPIYAGIGLFAILLLKLGKG